VILSHDECEMLRRIARRSFDDERGAFVLNGCGISAAKKLVKLGLAVPTETWRGKRPSGYFRITPAGLAAIGVPSC
jgi:hypothetical protein